MFFLFFLFIYLLFEQLLCLRTYIKYLIIYIFLFYFILTFVENYLFSNFVAPSYITAQVIVVIKSLSLISRSKMNIRKMFVSVKRNKNGLSVIWQMFIPCWKCLNLFCHRIQRSSSFLHVYFYLCGIGSSLKGSWIWHHYSFLVVVVPTSNGRRERQM